MKLPDAGIYQISAPNGFRYVGQSLDVPKRLNDHQKALRKGEHCNHKLQSAANEHGVDSLEFVPIFSIFNAKYLNYVEDELINEIPFEFRMNLVAAPSGLKDVYRGKGKRRSFKAQDVQFDFEEKYFSEEWLGEKSFLNEKLTRKSLINPSAKDKKVSRDRNDLRSILTRHALNERSSAICDAKYKWIDDHFYKNHEHWPEFNSYRLPNSKHRQFMEEMNEKLIEWQIERQSR